MQTQTTIWRRTVKLDNYSDLNRGEELDSAIHRPKKIRHKLQPSSTMAETP